MRRLVLALLATLMALPLAAPAVLAHPLGNFTINHATLLRVEPDRIVVDIVIDAAEVPTFQATAGLDRDGDGRLSPVEATGLGETRCLLVGRELSLTVDGATAGLRLTGAGVTFPAGNGGLPTMRTACVFEAPFAVAPGRVAVVTFRDGYEAARIGWREISAVGDRVTILADGVPETSSSDRLRAYPAGLAAAPDVRAVSLAVRSGGPALPAFADPEAGPVAGVSVAASGGPDPMPAGAEAVSAASGAAPGSAEAVPSILGQAPASPLIALAALLVAAALGAGHALTPGHGKTLMAAYLVGTRGTPRHALGLGLAVSVSHTAGILGLAVVILTAESRLPADLVVRVAPVIAAVSVVIIGAWMLASELRRRAADRRQVAMHDHGHDHASAGAHEHDHAAAHEHAHEAGHDHTHAGDHDHADSPGEHRHGPITHTHLPKPGATVTWRSLFLLGLAGGLVPSASALLLLLGSIAAGRPAWGVILVAAFGVGMAAVMTGIGLACVYARGLLDRAPGRVWSPGIGRLVPLGTAVAVLALGLMLTSQAIAGARLG